MTAIMITIKTILAICGGISIIGGATFVIGRWLKPAYKLKDRVEQLENNSTIIYKQIEDLIQANQHLCKSMLALMNNIITGNSVDNLKKVRDELQDYIIQK